MTTPVMERKSHEMLRKNNEEYRMRQAAKNALALSQSTSYGYYISKPSKFDNTLIPAIPRRKA
ncbi:uncharacterized protein BYT42DRAFT_559723 [Radiomyces spectabilis]|uniref:uncharacterized protein n=1 Tax=Radiomyces spectabilis TaxID=64574 RepID=UPI00221FA067|nr:uncharacterized protein BYT42DRAFT_559723 [Radiomyces spectabilis]KAI8388330.1 hypothetical protein BYT42DRAFT_559723 [Radiomyces spectabilis]